MCVMIERQDDIQGTVVVVDLEWIGNSLSPHMTHVTEIACVNISTRAAFYRHVRSLSKNGASGVEQVSAKQVYTELVAWLDQQDHTMIYLAAHNGIRYDSPVLRNAMLMHGVAIPSNVYFVDTLYHTRFQLQRHQIKLRGYSIDYLAEFCKIKIEPENRHTALYDACLLANILAHLSARFSLPIVSGAVQPLNCLSTMLVHGIGPKVCEHLPQNDLVSLCEDIISSHQSLDPGACSCYLESIQLKERLPLCNTSLIAQNVQQAAERYLQYIE